MATGDHVLPIMTIAEAGGISPSAPGASSTCCAAWTRNCVQNEQRATSNVRSILLRKKWHNISRTATSEEQKTWGQYEGKSIVQGEQKRRTSSSESTLFVATMASFCMLRGRAVYQMAIRNAVAPNAPPTMQESPNVGAMAEKRLSRSLDDLDDVLRDLAECNVKERGQRRKNPLATAAAEEGRRRLLLARSESARPATGPVGKRIAKEESSLSGQDRRRSVEVEHTGSRMIFKWRSKAKSISISKMILRPIPRPVPRTS